MLAQYKQGCTESACTLYTIMSSIIIMAELYIHCNTVSFIGVAAGSLVMSGSLACQGDCGSLRSLHSERMNR